MNNIITFGKMVSLFGKAFSIAGLLLGHDPVKMGIILIAAILINVETMLYEIKWGKR